MPAVSAPNKLLVADVVLDARVGGHHAVFTYSLQTSAEPGDALLVPLGVRSAAGYVTRVYEATEAELGFPFSRLRPATSRIEGLNLPSKLMRLVEFVASEYLCPLPVALGAAVPPGALGRLVSTWVLDEARLAEAPFELSASQREVVQAIRAAGGRLKRPKIARKDSSVQAALKSLRAKGIVREELGLARDPETRESPEFLRLSPDAERVEVFLRRHAKKKPAQALTLLRLQELEHSALTSTDIKSLCGVTDHTLRALLTAKLIEPADPEGPPPTQPPILNAHQALALDAILDAFGSRESKGFLLFGVTGSGKTEVYLRAISEALRQGKQALYLVPEIALATQAVSLLRERFGGRVAVLHSELPPKERFDNWMSVREGEAAVVIGARSALFAPLSNLGLIVMDEEHEASFKQESAPRYHAKRLAQKLAELHACPLVLGSATPSVESYQEAESERLTLLSLPERAASARLPDVRVVDLREYYRGGRPVLFSDELLDALRETLQDGRQAILFLNRRAYAPFLICRDCGKQFRCPRCAVSLAYSRRLGIVRCHHCDHRERPPQTCPDCGGTRVRPLGVGTEKVEEAVAEAFPEATVARLDRDVAQKRGRLESVLASFASGETQVLVGTQMVAKGLNFPNVTLVGVVAADVSLNLPDFRASERTFQLLSQVAGRAGRGASPGQVVIQTFNPEHTAVVCAKTHDFLAFYQGAKAERGEAGYPPFRRLVNVVLAGEDRSAVARASGEAKSRLAEALSIVGPHSPTLVAPSSIPRGEAPSFPPLQGPLSSPLPPAPELLGPVDCALERLHGKWRRHLLLKLPPDYDVGKVGEAVRDFEPKGVQVVVDVDPQSLM